MILAAAVFALLLGAYIFVVLPRAGLARRTLSVGVFFILIALVYGGSVELLGRPKPLRIEWRDAANAQVLSAVPIENEAIYLWLTTAGSPEPRAYMLPWSIETAQQIQNAMSRADAEGTTVEMAMPVKGDLDGGEPMFYARPQPPLPTKDYQGAGPLVYQQPDGAS